MFDLGEYIFKLRELHKLQRIKTKSLGGVKKTLGMWKKILESNKKIRRKYELLEESENKILGK